MKNFLASFLLFVGTLLPFALSAQDQALILAEKSRGVMLGDTGIQWVVDVKSTGNSPQNARFVAISQGNKIFAEVLQPESAQKTKYLAESGGQMWYWKPGISRPVAVPKRERLTGNAAIGDIASTSFVDGYKVEGSEPGEVNGEPATIYTMRANSLGDTYSRIRYWVTTKDSLGKKAEFYGRSDKLVRTSAMEYKNQAAGRPFLSKMVIEESGRTIQLTFSDIKLGKFPAKTFTRENLGGVPQLPRQP